MGPVERGESIDELLDRAVAAINRGDRVAATALAGQVLAVDEGNVDAEDLLTAPGSGGEIRRFIPWDVRGSLRRAPEFSPRARLGRCGTAAGDECRQTHR